MPRVTAIAPKLKIIKVRDLPPTVVFGRNLYRASPYAAKLQELAAIPDSVLVIGDTPTQITSLKKAAEKLGMELLFARNNGDVLVKVIDLSESQRRLRLLLREPRTVSEIEASKLELDTKAELRDLAAAGLVEMDAKARWKLTAQGMAQLRM